jgi:hypothetical protein
MRIFLLRPKTFLWRQFGENLLLSTLNMLSSIQYFNPIFVHSYLFLLVLHNVTLKIYIFPGLQFRSVVFYKLANITILAFI